MSLSPNIYKVIADLALTSGCFVLEVYLKVESLWVNSKYSTDNIVGQASSLWLLTTSLALFYCCELMWTFWDGLFHGKQQLAPASHWFLFIERHRHCRQSPICWIKSATPCGLQCANQLTGQRALITEGRWQMGPVFVLITNSISSGSFFNFDSNLLSLRINYGQVCVSLGRLSSYQNKHLNNNL